MGWNKRSLVTTDLKRVYSASTADEAEQYLTEFEVKWNDAYPPIAKSWRNNWMRIIPFFDYSPEIRKIIYTTNAIESVNTPYVRLGACRIGKSAREVLRKNFNCVSLKLFQYI